MKNSIGRYWYIFLIIGIFLFIGVLYMSNSLPNQTRSFSSYTLLSSSWQKYKERFIKQSGRVVDENGVTTSEAQSYALLQSVWADDMPTFNQVWNWTSRNLKRPADHLFGWRYGNRPDNTIGFLPNGGDNSASDADGDIAFALIMASRRWHKTSYRAAALPILDSMWNSEVATVSGQPYLTAGNWASSSAEIVINPSYFAPYAWRVFAQEDKMHNWNGLIAPAYDLLKKAGQTPLDKGGGAGLPPDWLSLTPSGNIQATNLPNLNSDYSFDATRTPWRIALDYQQYGDKRALDYLQTLGFLVKEYRSGKKLYESYTHDGHPLNGGESPVMYATSLGIFMNVQPDLANQIYQNKILNLYSTDSNSFRQNLSYYEENWLWFGSALYLKALYKF